MQNGELITTSEVSELLGISKASVTLWANPHLAGLPVNKQGHKLYSNDDVEYLKKIKALLKKNYKHEEIKEMLASDVNQTVEKSKKQEKAADKNLTKPNNTNFEVLFNKIYGKYKMQVDEIALKAGFAFIKGEQPMELKEEAVKLQERLEIIQEIRQEFQNLICSL